jgi:DNA-binding transcriptional LysR family regulator
MEARLDRLESDRMFAAVMELGSFAAAAARLGTSSGQASKLVARLEGDLGVRLLNRTTRALSPTEAGQAYFDRVRRILEDFDELDREVRSAARTPKGHLRVTAPLSYGRAGLLPALNAFALRYPEVELDVQFTDRMVNLVDEGFDVAVRVGRPADSSLVARKLGEVTLDLVAAPAYLARAGEPAHPRDLARHACILDTNMRDPTLWRFRDGGRALTVNVTGPVRYSNAEACLGAAEDGLGFALVPGFLSGPSLRAGRVVRRLEGFAEGRLGVHLLYPPGRHLAAKVRAFIDFMAQNFRAGHG